MKVLTNLNLFKGELQNARLQQLADSPANPVSGQIYYNTTDNRAYYYDGDDWVGMDGLGATMTGTDIIQAINSAASGAIDFAKLSVTKANLSLEKVTNDKQVKALDENDTTDGNIPTWDGKNGDKLKPGYSVDDTTLNNSSTSIPRSDVVKAYVDGLLKANDAMIYKGTIGTGGTPGALPSTYNVGWAYKVVEVGTYAGHKCEIGDMIIAIVARTGSGNQNSDWSVIQSNIDGAVIGPATSTTDNFVAFSNGNGKLVKDSGYSASDFSLDGHDHDARYPRKVSQAIGNNSATSFEVTHNLNSFDVVVMVRETASPYEVVYTDVYVTTKDKVKVEFAVKPANNQYTVVVVG